jgi:hypothetical protein
MRWIVALVISFVSLSASAHEIPKQCFDTVEELRQVFKKDHAYKITIKQKECWHIHRDVKSTEAKKIVSQPLYKSAPPDYQRMRDYLWLKCNNIFAWDEECLNWR